MIRRIVLALPASLLASLLACLLLPCLLLPCLLLPGPALAEELTFSSLEWPPYTGADLPGGGVSTQVARAACQAAGMEFSVRFLPWQRAVKEAEEGKTAGYFPEYHAAEIEKDFIFSQPIGESPLGLVEPVAKPLHWSSLSDLAPYTIGTVAGYVNTAEFDAMAAKGELKVDPAVDDLTSLKKLVLGRVDAVVIDKNVFEYLMATEPALKSAQGQLQFNNKVLENKGLYMCFARTPQGQQLVERFNQGLSQVDIEAISASALAGQ